MPGAMRLRLPCVFLVLGAVTSACGKIPDAGGDDDDTPDAGPTTGQVVLHLHHDDGAPVAGAPAVFTHADGTLVGTADSAADGTITYEITAGDVVHVGWNEGMEKRLYSIYALAPGDEIDINNREPSPPVQDVGQITVAFPGSFPGATRYGIHFGCFSNEVSGTTPYTTNLSSDCLNASNQVTVVITARDANGTVLAAAAAPNRAFTPGTTVGFPSWSTPASVGFDLTNTSPQAQYHSVELQTFRDGMRYEQAEPTLVGTHAEARFATGYAETVQYFVNAQFVNEAIQPDGRIILTAKRPAAGLPGSINADFAQSLPRLHQAAYVIATGALEWTMSGSESQLARHEQADLLFGMVVWNAAGSSETNRWTIMAPGGTNPPLMANLHSNSGFGPGLTPIILGVVLIELDVDVIQGYGAAKNDFGTGLFDGGALDKLPMLSGSASMSGAGFN
jgi:hypothetical protein